MELKLIKNDDTAKITLYRLARSVYAETLANSLAEVEAITSAVGNLCTQKMRELSDIAIDPNVFECADKNSIRHQDLFVNSDDPKFQMVLRTVKKLLTGQLPDSVNGATRFHRTDSFPEWANSIGYIAEVGEFLFY